MAVETGRRRGAKSLLTSRWWRWSTLPLTVVVASTALGAQAATRDSVVARISGVVFDSVGGRPLADALVQLVPAAEAHRSRSVQTGGRGAFAFDSVGAGRYLVGFQHPLLDSLGLTAPLSVIDIRVSGDLRVSLSTPSPRTMIASLCGARAAGDSTGVLIGYVRSASDGRGRGGAHVRASWAEIAIGADGIRRLSPAVEGEASDAGGIALCGVPVGSSVLVRAWSGRDSSGFAELEVPAAGLLRRDLYVGAARAVSVRDTTNDSATVAMTVPRGDGSLRGDVRRADGRPIAGARLVFWGAAIEATSGDAGAYRMQDLPIGTYTVEARALGFLPRRRAVDIMEGNETVADLTLDSFATYLDTVKVTARRVFSSRQMQEFERRKKAGFGYFLDEDAINKRDPFFMSDLLRTVPGVTVSPGQSFGDRVLMRGTGFQAYCAPTVFLDGSRVFNDGGQLDAIVNVQDVRAIEVYSRGSSVPVEFQTLDGCGSLVVWTGARRPRQ